MSKANNNVVEDMERLSQLEGGQVLRDVHSYPGHYLRVKDANSIVEQFWDSYQVTYNVNGDPEEVCYFKGTSSHSTEIAFSADVSSSLNNTYFLINSAKTGLKYHVWYNVNGAGVDPAPTGSEGIEVPIAENEAAPIVAYATELVLNTALKSSFEIDRTTAVLKITNTILGEIDDTVDNNTGFAFSNTQGVNELIDKVIITYNNEGDPIYKGTVLKGYSFNVIKGQFELETSTKGNESLFPLIAASNWMNLASYDEITPQTIGTVTTLQYKEDGNLIGEATIDYINETNWSLRLDKYINDDDGDILLDDDGTPLNLD